jgi:hypothetical protein
VKAVPVTGQREGDFTDNSNRCHTFDEFAAGPFSGHVWPLPFCRCCKNERVSEVSDVAKSECCEVAAVCS